MKEFTLKWNKVVHLEKGISQKVKTEEGQDLEITLISRKEKNRNASTKTKLYVQGDLDPYCEFDDVFVVQVTKGKQYRASMHRQGRDCEDTIPVSDYYHFKQI